jgi:hypothetical protein
MSKEYIVKPVAANPAKLDGRVAFSSGLSKPEVYDVHGGPHVILVSGVRVNDDHFPSSSGTL